MGVVTADMEAWKTFCASVALVLPPIALPKMASEDLALTCAWSRRLIIIATVVCVASYGRRHPKSFGPLTGIFAPDSVKSFSIAGEEARTQLGGLLIQSLLARYWF